MRTTPAGAEAGVDSSALGVAEESGGAEEGVEEAAGVAYLGKRPKLPNNESLHLQEL